MNRFDPTNLAHIMRLGNSVTDATAYFIAMAGNHDGKLTITFSCESPRVTVFLGDGPEAPIGFGESVPEALADANPEAMARARQILNERFPLVDG